MRAGAEGVHEIWGYCWKWDWLGVFLSSAALLAPLFCGATLARLPRRPLHGVFLGGTVAAVGLVCMQFTVLIVWNGFYPAICNRLP